MAIGPIGGGEALNRYISAEVGADLSAARGKFVEQSAEGKVTVVNAITDVALGVVATNAPTTATSQVDVEIQISGIAMVLCDGSGTAIAAGDNIGPNSSGIGVKVAAVPGGANYQWIYGVALEGTSSANVFLPVLMTGRSYIQLT